MIERPDLLRAVDRRWERTVYTDMTYHDALLRFEALWDEARALRGDSWSDWRTDLEPDLAIARAVNGLPPA